MMIIIYKRVERYFEKNQRIQQIKTMKKKDLKRHLNIYSIFKKRHTTINHAFASAISYFDNYNETEIDKALKKLGQKPNNDLKCVYCQKKAETWDHLEALVKNGMFTGFGHQLGNLVPCCKKCNSSKGKKTHIDYINGLNIEDEQKKIITNLLNNYKIEFKNNIIDIESEEYLTLTEEYFAIKSQIFELMKEADKKAELIRQKLNFKSK